ncbi:UDP-N-acetylmuramoyl-L-alanyl-D-glutamate--2,6-diaminopimelate ligase [Prolixibacteraceae bacterium JC049]|nr:UDP-N-acetylmuramoyl-L-alanyl-D-glutamate--2,6-diaminopimelate ligase [Prolixibacteraceae bacterium JC049]
MKLKELIINQNYKQLIGAEDRDVAGLHFDSRAIEADFLFIAVRGTHVDGHRFIEKAIESGAKTIVVEELPEQLNDDVTYIEVENSARTVGQLAAQYYGNPSAELKLVGVTGTNGKTTIATLLYQLFSNMGYHTGLFSTIDIRIGTQPIPATHTTPDAISLNKLMREMVDAGCEYCFMEVSSHSIDQFRIEGLQFDGGIFTNLTHDHLDYHQTFKAYLNAKKAFFDGLPKNAFALTNADDKNGMVMLQNTAAKKQTYSQRAMADFHAKALEPHFDGMLLEMAGSEVWTHFVGKFNVSNLLAVYASAVLLGHDATEVLTHISSLKPVAGRFETIKSKDGRFAIVDYAHTPDALKNVLNSITELRTSAETLFTVVGAGGDRDKTKRPEMAHEACLLSDRVILTSDNPRTEDPEQIIKDMQEGVEVQYRNKVLAITNRREAIRAACMMAQPGDIILVAGKGHEDYQEINGVKHHFDDREVIREIFDENA